ncbi:MAG: hypothetical protein AAGJ28_00390 [Pseudomonadota bacterium]
MASHHGSGGGGLSGAWHGVATVLGLVGAVFLAPLAWPLVSADIRSALMDLYAPGTAAWLHLGCHVLIYPLTYFAVRMGAIAAFTAIVVAITRRLR